MPAANGPVGAEVVMRRVPAAALLLAAVAVAGLALALPLLAAFSGPGPGSREGLPRRRAGEGENG
jgi:hypothetical protein